jgi:hypothetical protein
MKILLPALLASASVLLGAAIVYEAAVPLDPPAPETIRVPRARPSAAVPAYAPPGEELFADIDTRPLFSAARKPLPEPEQTNAAVAATADFSLVGVIMGGARAVALVRLKSTNTTSSAVVGDMVNGWRVARIDSTTVTLHANGSDFIVQLAGPANQPPTAALPPLAQPQADNTAAANPDRPAAAPTAAAAPTPASTTAPAHPAPTAASPGAVPPKPASGVPHQTIAPEALRGAPIDPATGEPTL